jgi:hypothetical protein
MHRRQMSQLLALLLLQMQQVLLLGRMQTCRAAEAAVRGGQQFLQPQGVLSA